MYAGEYRDVKYVDGEWVSGGLGDIYRVKPIGEVNTDLEDRAQETRSYYARGARVVEVVERNTEVRLQFRLLQLTIGARGV
jgi:hypothetical protein